MIKTYPECNGTMCEIKGNSIEVSNDLCAIISTCLGDASLLALFNEALQDNLLSVKNKIKELENDKNNSGN